jgi:hypothetical protein
MELLFKDSLLDVREKEEPTGREKSTTGAVLWGNEPSRCIHTDAAPRTFFGRVVGLGDSPLAG